MKDITEKTKMLLAFSFLKGVGPATLRKVIDVSDFVNFSVDTIASKVPKIRSALNEEPDAWQKAMEKAIIQIDLAQKDNARILSVTDVEYPSLLKTTKDDPLILYVKGHFSPDPSNSVALIGTREPTSHGKIITARIAEFFLGNRWSIVSGLALGCDTVAHETAVSLQGHTIAVFAHGLHVVSPSQNKALAHAILDQGGAWVTEYPYGHNATPHQFVKRDKIQAGLAQGVVMVQSDLKGGSLHASRAAISYGRWLAVPQPTQRDLDRKESKVKANSLISEGCWQKTSELLKCDESASNLVKLIRSKEDYPNLLQAMEHTNPKPPAEQNNLF